MKILRRAVLAGLVLLALIGHEPPALATCYGFRDGLTLMARETITVSTTAIGPTAATIAPATDQTAVLAFFDIETNNLRYREDGIAPTSSVGSPVVAPNTIEVCGAPQIKKFLMIRSGAADATAWARYYRKGD